LVIIYLKILLILSLLNGQEIQVSVDKNTLSASDYLKLEVQATGSKEFPNINIENLKLDFDIISGPNQETNIQFINGRRSSMKKLTWLLSPKKLGRLFIPILIGSIDGIKFRSDPIAINVIKEKSTSLSDEVFIKVEINKENAYIGEQITLTLKLYKKEDIKVTSIDEFKMPDFRGFWVEELHNPQRLKYQKQLEIIDGIKYQVANLGQRALFPMPAKKHIIPSINIKIGVEIQKKRNRRDPFFDPFFSSYFSDSKVKILRSKETKIDIKTFPDNKPKNFTGAVGAFDIVSSVDVETIKVNEGVTFTISLEGTGNLNFFTFPEIIFPKNIEVFQPNEIFLKDVFRDQLTGKKSIEYILIPRKSGEYILPKITLTYFNLQKDKWDKVSSKSIKIFVQKIDGENIEDNVPINRDKYSYIEKDIRYLTSNLSKPNIFLKKNIIVKIYIIAVIFLIAPFLFKSFNKLNILDIDKYFKKNSKNVVMKVLKNEKINLHNRIILSLYEYLQQKLNLSSKNLDQDQIKILLNSKIESKLLDELILILDECNEAKFSEKIEITDQHIKERYISIIEKLDKIL
jgi:hypothetical protein